MHKQLGYHLGIFIIITVHLFDQGLANIYNPFTNLRQGRRLNGNNNQDSITTPHFLLNDDTLQFSTSKPTDTADKQFRNSSLTHFDSLFNNQSSNLNRPKTRSTLLNPQHTPNSDLNLFARSGSIDTAASTAEKRQNSHPMNDMLSGFMQLIGSGMKPNSRSPAPLQPNNPMMNNHQLLQALLNNPNIMNDQKLKAIRLVPLPNGQQFPPNGIILGQQPNRPAILPLQLHKQQPNHRPSIQTQPQISNQLLQMLSKNPNIPSNLTSLHINNFLSSINANNQSLDQLLSNINSSPPKNYMKVESAEVSKLLLGSINHKPTIKNEILFSSTIAPSSTLTGSNIDNSIDSVHFPNELFARTSISRSSNDQHINPSSTRQNDPIHTAKPIADNQFDLTNATVISNNHMNKPLNGRPFNRNQIASSFPPIYSSHQPSIQPTNQLSTNQLLSNSHQLNADISQPSITTNWQSFEMFNTDQNLIKPTRIWNDRAPDIITKAEEASTFDITVSNKMGTNNSKIDLSAVKPNDYENLIKSTSVAGLHESSLATNQPSREPEVVYGRPANRPIPSNDNNDLAPAIQSSSTTTQGIVTSVSLNQKTNDSKPDSIGRPLVYPVDMDLVKPQVVATNQLPSVSPVIITESGGGSVFINAQQKHFKLKPIQKTSTIPSMQIGSTMNVFGNNGDSFNRKPGGLLSNSANPLNPFSNFTSTANNNDKPRPNQVRRPTFRPKPATPLTRIDTCIEGDDSTCGANLNEHCKLEGGISSCQCRPGFGRQTQRGLCIPTTSLQMSLKLDKLGENKLQFSKNLLNSDSEDFQYLEFESIQAVNSLFQNSRLSKLFLGIRINRFYPVQGKIMMNATIVLERNNITRSNSIKKQLQQELSRVINAKNNALGDSPLLVDSIALPRLDDVNECADPQLNDCSRNARCINDLGTFTCVCKPGFEDRYALASQLANSKSSASNSQLNNQKNLVMKLGRVCLGCSPAYCSNRGECSIANGEKKCLCKGNYMGARCDIDAEVLAVAFGGSLAALIIIIITILCLYVWNQKWKNEQQKIEAMSSNSGQTFSYVNKPANTTSFRFGMERMVNGWNNSAFEPTTLQNNASNYNYYVNPEQILISTSQHVYATPNREEVVNTPDQLLEEETNNHFYNTRRSKSSRNCTSVYQPTIYNEAEFSTRKTLYTPSHLIIGSAARPKYAMY